MPTTAKRIVVDCLDCERPIKLTFHPLIGQIITCPHCDAEFEVIEVDPLELDWVYFEPEDAEEDWSWDWDNIDEDEEEDQTL